MEMISLVRFLVRVLRGGTKISSVSLHWQIHDAMFHKKTQPNYKVDEFFAHFNEVSLSACDPSMNLSTDEQDQRFAGKGAGTVRCKFKREGDGYFVDSMCERGCASTFHPRNKHPPNVV